MNKYISSACALLAIMLMSIVTQSCIGTTLDDTNDPSNFETPALGQAYTGVWQMDDNKTSGIVVARQGYFTAFDIPYAWMADKIFAGSKVSDVVGSDGNDRLGCVMATTQDGTTLYTLNPKTWYMTATVDGSNRHVSLYMAPQAGSTDDMSWGRISKNGVMNIMLCMTGYSLDGGNMQPLAMRLTFTAMRK